MGGVGGGGEVPVRNVTFRTSTFLALKKFRFPGPTPSNDSRNGCCTPQNHYVPRRINNRYINS